MNGKGKLSLNAGIERSWQVLMDPNVLEGCIMGCEKLELIDENKYEAELAMGIAAVKGRYSSTIELTDLEKPKHYKLIVKGEGGPGTVEAVGNIDLVAEDETTTTLHYTYDAEVGGKVAMIGQRMLGGVAKMLIQDFFKKFKKELESTKQHT
ncbi:carbon monoxide dehydrogenase subunit G [Bacillus sp. N1-1]|uniref:SRPBCC family protein n=1 Tax=Bacillus sp. N1-1 TaxID=2682541 RepID=UPI00131808C7|nr:carbon monoxide dehydrogenase subunit G [Bacillus sp. N1-1]QHA93091.1 carbon monoxide dehydrogenase [Bacillus sp. N1-1]